MAKSQRNKDSIFMYLGKNAWGGHDYILKCRGISYSFSQLYRADKQALIIIHNFIKRSRIEGVNDE